MPNREPFVLPTVQEAADAIGVDVPSWQGRCYEIACAIRGKFDIDCRPCYGHWLGPVAPGSFFADRAKAPFQRHGWLQLEDGRIIDPTRWVFENVEPYIFFAKDEQGYYDEGGDVWRKTMNAVKEVPGADADPRKVPLVFRDDVPDTVLFIIEIFDQDPKDLNLLQVAYLANMSRDELGKHAYPIFSAIDAAGQGAFIPIDNYEKILGARRGRKKGRKEPGLFGSQDSGPYEEKR
jgi:hypothetical protein